jgi:hypothetical protein
MLSSVAILAYFSYLRSQARPRTLFNDSYPGILAAAFLGLGLLGVLWLLAEYADQAGVRAADRIVRELRSDPSVTVYSVSPLAIFGPGVKLTKIGADGDKFRYAYTGLRLFESGNGKIILLPSGWTKGDSVYVLRDDESMRIDVSA